MSILDTLKGLMGGAAAPQQPEEAPVSVDGTIGARVVLDETLEGSAKDLILTFETATDDARRSNVESVSKAYAFYDGVQYGGYNATTGLYAQIPTHVGQGPQGDANSAYVVNRFAGYIDSIISLIVANHPTEKAIPGNPAKPRSVKSAKMADQVLRLYDANNDIRDQLRDEIWHLCLGGTIGVYIRHVRDGARFGVKTDPVLEEFDMQLSPSIYGCASCGTQTPVDESMGVCAGCQQPHAPDSMIPATTAKGFRQATDPATGEPMVNKVPNGCEVGTVYGVLSLRLPPTAREQWQYPYLGIAEELPISKLKDAYPEVADKIQADELEGSGEEAEARLKRIRLAMGVDLNGRQRSSIGVDLVTFRQYWFRPWAFQAIEDADTKAKFLGLFPDGMYVAFAGSTLCEARNESMDDHWRVVHAKPGVGQIRSGLAKSLIPLQEISNDIVNQQRDAGEFGMSFFLADPAIVNVGQFKQSRIRAGAMYQSLATGDKKLSDGIYASPAAQISPQMVALREELDGPASQFLIGAFPAAFGAGGDTGNDTAHGLAIERDAAMGRIGLHWGTIKNFHAELAPLKVKAFVQGRTEAATLSVPAPGGKYKALEISPADIDLGEIAPRYETLEDYPTSWPQRKDALTNLLQGPAGMPIMQDLSNIEEIKRTLGISDINFPGEVAWNKEMNVIEMLLKQQPVPVGPGLNPMGMPDPMMPPQMGPSIPLDPILDEPMVVLQAIKAWAASEEGQEAAMQNPGGYANVRFRAQMAAMAMAPPPAPPGAEGPPGEGPPGAGPSGPHPGGGPPESEKKPPPGPTGHIEVHHNLTAN